MQHLSAPGLPAEVQFKLVQNSTSTGVFGFFWRTRAVTWAAAFSLLSELKAEVALISYQNQKGSPTGL